MKQVFRKLLANERDIQFAYAFGSAITEPVFHDIDVAVYLSGPMPMHRDRCLELAEQLTRTVGLPVDVQPLAEAPIAFAFHVFRGQLLFSRDDERLADLMEETVRRYLDVEPLVRRATREAFAREEPE
jgi:predicted nucleotidyltransferase